MLTLSCGSPKSTRSSEDSRLEEATCYCYCEAFNHRPAIVIKTFQIPALTPRMLPSGVMVSLPFAILEVDLILFDEVPGLQENVEVFLLSGITRIHNAATSAGLNPPYPSRFVAG